MTVCTNTGGREAERWALSERGGEADGTGNPRCVVSGLVTRYRKCCECERDPREQHTRDENVGP